MTTTQTDSKYAGLLARALHPSTPPAEATNCFGRLLANPAFADALRAGFSDGGACDTCDHNRAELRRAIRTIAELREERDLAVSALRAAQRAAGERHDARREDTQPADPGRDRSRGFRRPRPIVELDDDAVCTQCGADLPAGSRARTYPGGRVYGVDCHGRRR